MSDEQYNKLINKQLQESEEVYFADIENDKELVWDRIEVRLSERKAIPFWIYSAAAAVLLIMGLGFIFNLQLRYKNNEISKLQLQLKTQQSLLKRIQLPVYYAVNYTDTINKWHKNFIYSTVQTKDTIFYHDTITNLVNLTDTVFIKENEVKQIADNVIKEEKEFNDNKVITENQKLKKKARNRRFIILFGKPDNDSQEYSSTDYETQRLITLKSK